MVKEENQDEFKEVHDLTSRYETLKKENERLQKETLTKEQELKGLQNDIEGEMKRHQSMKIKKTNEYNDKKSHYEKEEQRK